MSGTETKPASRFVASTTVEKTTDAGSKLIAFQLTAEGERALTVEVRPVGPRPEKQSDR